MDDLIEATGIKITMDDMSNFQESVGNLCDLKNSRSSRSSRFTSQGILCAMSIFDPRKYQVWTLLDYFVRSSFDTKIQQYGKDWQALMIDGMTDA